MAKLKKRFDILPPDLQKEVVDFINFLIYKNNKKPGKAKFDWAGSLSGLKNKYTSVELQHKISQMRSEEK